VLADLAGKNNATPHAVALAWLLRHPARIVPIIGASNPEHLIANCAADRIVLSREEWYALFRWSSAADIESRELLTPSTTAAAGMRCDEGAFDERVCRRFEHKH